MKVKLLSDLHLETGTQEPGYGDVLVLAGDIVNAIDLKESSLHSYRFKDFLKKCGENYNKVFYVMGNHENYDCDINETSNILREHLPNNFTLLDDSTECYEGVNFIGGTMWTNFNREQDLETVEDSMNDYNYIQNGDKLVKASDILQRHYKTVNYLKDTLSTLEGSVIVVTHHAPHTNSLHGYYNEVPAGYCSDLTELICDNRIDVWCHGHIHHNNDYMIGDTRVVSNPHGYKYWGENETFDSEFTL